MSRTSRLLFVHANHEKCLMSDCRHRDEVHMRICMQTKNQHDPRGATQTDIDIFFPPVEKKHFRSIYVYWKYTFPFE